MSRHLNKKQSEPQIDLTKYSQGSPQSVPRCHHGKYRSNCRACAKEHREVVNQTGQILKDALARIYENDDGIKSTMEHALTRAYYLGQKSITPE